MLYSDPRMQRGMNMSEHNDEMVDAVAFVGDTLAPFFLEDPEKGAAGESFAAMASIDAQAAAGEWPFAEHAQALTAFKDMSSGLAFGITDALTWEYRRLFVGPGHLPVPPWGSVYTDRECVVFGETTLALRAWMREHGIACASDEKTPEDHIGLMLALMSHICRTQPDALDEYLCNYLLTWAPHYLEELADEANHPFYRGLASLTRSTLVGIRDFRGLSVKTPRFYK